MELFITVLIFVYSRLRIEDIWRRTRPSESLYMQLESSLLHQIQTAAVLRVLNCFIILFELVFYKQT